MVVFITFVPLCAISSGITIHIICYYTDICRIYWFLDCMPLRHDFFVDEM